MGIGWTKFFHLSELRDGIVIQEEIRKKRLELEGEKKKLQEEVRSWESCRDSAAASVSGTYDGTGWEGCRRSAVAEVEEEYNWRHIRPREELILKIDKELAELQEREREAEKEAAQKLAEEKKYQKKVASISMAITRADKRLKCMRKQEEKEKEKIERKFGKKMRPTIEVLRKSRDELAELQKNCPKGFHSEYGPEEKQCPVCLKWTWKEDDGTRAHY